MNEPHSLVEAYAKFRFELVQRILGERMTPLQVASYLDAQREQFVQLPHASNTMRREAILYREMGETWENVDWDRWEIDRGRRVEVYSPVIPPEPSEPSF